MAHGTRISAALSPERRPLAGMNRFELKLTRCPGHLPAAPLVPLLEGRPAVASDSYAQLARWGDDHGGHALSQELEVLELFGLEESPEKVGLEHASYFHVSLVEDFPDGRSVECFHCGPTPAQSNEHDRG